MSWRPKVATLRRNFKRVPTDEQIIDLLSLCSATIAADELARLTDDLRREVFYWAWSTHMHASDHGNRVPVRPTMVTIVGPSLDDFPFVDLVRPRGEL